MSKKLRFYVYVIRDPRPGKDNVPIYVGKGHGRRAFMHLQKNRKMINPLLARTIAKCRALNLEPPIEIVAYFNMEEDAFAAETNLIIQYGRRDLRTGSLCNLTDGGEGTSGSLIGAELMRKLNADPKQRAANIERLKQRNADPEFRIRADKQAAAVFRELHSDPAFQKAHAMRNGTRLSNAFQTNPILLQEWTERQRRKNADPQFTKKRLAGLRRKHADPEYGNRMRAGLAVYNNTAEARAEKTERLRKLMADPEWIRARAEKRRAKMAARKLLTSTQQMDGTVDGD